MNTTEDFDKLVNNMGDTLNGKEMEIVIPALTMLLARAGVMGGVDPASLLAYIVMTVSRIYDEADPSNEIVH
jgi:hypothetical protein